MEHLQQRNHMLQDAKLFDMLFNHFRNQFEFSPSQSLLTYLQFSHSLLRELVIIHVLLTINEHVYSDDQIVLMLIRP